MIPELTIDRDTLSVQFQRFDLQSYELFIKTKKLPEALIVFDEINEHYTVKAPSRFAKLLGVEPPAYRPAEELPLADFHWDYSRDIIQEALRVKRFAMWEDTGFGKTLQFLEWSRQVMHRTGGKVLIFTLPTLINQTVEESEKFYRGALPVHILETREALIAWCKDPDGPRLAITNYHKMIADVIPELRWLAGVALDEGSILRSGGGVIKWNLIKSCRGIEYKLICTATPAPNDTMEYASQAAFLEKLRSEGEILWTFFAKDKAGNWRVKAHAKEAFYRFMADWSIYLRNPARYGWKDNTAPIPEPQVHEYKLGCTSEQLTELRKIVGKNEEGELGIAAGQKLGVTQRTKLNQIAKGFIYTSDKPRRIQSLKPQFVTDLFCFEVLNGRRPLVWTIYDEESEVIVEHLNRIKAETGLRFNVATLHGRDKEDDRIATLEAYRTGKIDGLISKASLIGFGMNLQHCGAMIFSGWNDSYEAWYQAVRRAYRYGQKKSVQIHIPFVPELEGVIYENILRKKGQFEEDATIMEEYYIKARQELLAA
jgi:hypothetical protein